MVRVVIQAILSSGRVPHVRGDEEPVDLSPLLPFGVGRGGPVVGGWPHYRVSSGQRDRELVRLEVPVPRKYVGMIPQGVDMRQHLIKDAPVPLACLRVRSIIPVDVEKMQSTTAHLQVNDNMHPASFSVVHSAVWDYRRCSDPRENCQSSLGSATRRFKGRHEVAVIATGLGFKGSFGDTA
eukprot:6483953-Amphidinium_carterae.1